jgi:hypothetical protein
VDGTKVTEPLAIELKGIEIRQVKSMADYSFNLTINIPEYNRALVKPLIDWIGDQADIVMVNVTKAPNSR